MIFRVQLLICWRVIWLLQVYQVSIYPPRSRSQRQVRSAALHSLPLGQGLQGVLQRQRLKVAEGSILQSFSYLENRMPHLVGGFNPSENYESQLRLLFPWKNEIHVPNHHFPLSVGRTLLMSGSEVHFAKCELSQSCRSHFEDRSSPPFPLPSWQWEVRPFKADVRDDQGVCRMACHTGHKAPAFCGAQTRLFMRSLLPRQNTP